jgi:hypothetical protein
MAYQANDEWLGSVHLGPTTWYVDCGCPPVPVLTGALFGLFGLSSRTSSMVGPRYVAQGTSTRRRIIGKSSRSCFGYVRLRLRSYGLVLMVLLGGERRRNSAVGVLRTKRRHRSDVIYADDNAYWADGPLSEGANELGKSFVRLRERVRQESEN